MPHPMSLPQWPRRGNHLTRALGRWVLAVMGWRLEGEFPNVPRMVAIGAPHTSNWDWVLTMSTVFAVGLRLHWMGKDSLFRGPLGPVMRWLGGVSINRGVRSGVVAQSAAALRASDKMVLCIAPEGTRSRVAQWKTGFYHIAREAGVPLVLCYVNYPRRLVGIGPVFVPSGDVEGDLAEIRAFYRKFRGRRMPADA